MVFHDWIVIHYLEEKKTEQNTIDGIVFILSQNVSYMLWHN